ncbi:MAG TPA: serine/threonine-protein kinase [Polyangia bacterium]|jgi:tRNA A-37 threonylcarbamoyl transferase component Bud32|nr:serine/threonine-protein kinase [Polyangia bacterium]
MPDGTDPSSHGAADPLVGRVLSQRYRILAKLGEGAMASVYLAEHSGVGTNIVLKILLPDLARRPEFVDRFLQEVKIASDIHHDNIIDIFYSGRSPEGMVFLAMEYVPGTNLQDLLAHHGALPWERAQPILHQVADALTAAHAQGVIHRDVKPDNVLIREQQGPDGVIDFVKVVDFGISNLAGGLAQTKGIFGTPEYMPPEQAQAQPPDPRDDVYAFGCLMYQVVTGTLPFQAPTLQQLLMLQIQAPPEPPRQRRPDLPITEEVEDMILRAMQKRRADRWPTMSQLADALGAIPAVPRTPTPPPVVEPAPQLPPPVLPSPSRRRVLARVALAATVVALFITAAALYHGPRPVPGRLEIVTDPSDAAIYIGEAKLADHSPLLLEASPGRYTLRVVRDGYDPVYQVFEIRSREALQLPVNLPVSEATRLELTSDPPGARLRLDGLLLGDRTGEARTPYTVMRVKPGHHTLEMDDIPDRAPWRTELDVVLGAQRHVNGELAPLPATTPDAGVAPAVVAPAKHHHKDKTKEARNAEKAPPPPADKKAAESPPPSGPLLAPTVKQDKGIMYLDINKRPEKQPDSGAGAR